jgi:hypothetical protein
MHGLLPALVLLVLPAPSTVAASPHDPGESDERICIMTANMWGGTAEDVRHIHDIPVPESYRHLYEDDPCQNFGWPMETLVTWHLAYGDEASAAAALSYLEAHFTAGSPPPAHLPALLAAAVRSAGPALRAAGPALATVGPGYEAARRALERHLTIRRVRDLTGARQRFLFLATQYVRAAEVYGSAAFLARANAFYAPVRDSFAQVQAPDAEDRLGIGPNENNRLNELAMRLAVATARIGGRAADWGTAEIVVENIGTPTVRLAGAHAYENGAEFCDMESRADLAPVREACREDAERLERDATNYWVSRAELDLLSDPPSPDDAEAESESHRNAQRLLERSRQGGFLGELSRDRRIQFSLARTNQLARAMHSAAARGTPGARYDAARLGDEALFALVDVERLAPPPWAPAWFRRIAEPYLAIAADLDALRAAEPESDRTTTADPRTTAYFRHTLAALDAIAVGDPPPVR